MKTKNKTKEEKRKAKLVKAGEAMIEIYHPNPPKRKNNKNQETRVERWARCHS